METFNLSHLFPSTQFRSFLEAHGYDTSKMGLMQGDQESQSQFSEETEKGIPPEYDVDADKDTKDVVKTEPVSS